MLQMQRESTTNPGSPRLADFKPEAMRMPFTDILGNVAGESVLVIGPGSVDLMCALLRGGATSVTCLRSHDRIEPESATLVIVRGDLSSDRVTAVLPAVRRALVPTGRLVILARCGSADVDLSGLQRRLLQSGFATVRLRQTETAIAAERPAFRRAA